MLAVSKWKLARDVNIGDHVLGVGGVSIVMKSKKEYWINDGINVLNLDTDSGLPFIVGGCIVRANNAIDKIEWVTNINFTDIHLVA